jgi:hypothetical protein
MKVVYLRFGELPVAGRSYNRERKKLEAGVGVWEAIQTVEQYQILMPRMKRDEWQPAAIELHASHGKPCFVVTGTPLTKFGSFGETLLTDVQIVEEINPCAGRAWRQQLERPEELAEDHEREGAYD